MAPHEKLHTKQNNQTCATTTSRLRDSIHALATITGRRKALPKLYWLQTVEEQCHMTN